VTAAAGAAARLPGDGTVLDALPVSPVLVLMNICLQMEHSQDRRLQSQGQKPRILVHWAYLFELDRLLLHLGL
jgi:hypothetical protein